MALVIGVLVFAPVFHSKAADNNIGFDFKLKPNCANSGSSSRYRETSSVITLGKFASITQQKERVQLLLFG